jgi:hypothetical protein
VGLRVSDWWDRVELAPLRRAGPFYPVRCQMYTTSYQLHITRTMSQTCSTPSAQKSAASIAFEASMRATAHARDLQSATHPDRSASCDRQSLSSAFAYWHLYTQVDQLRMSTLLTCALYPLNQISMACQKWRLLVGSLAPFVRHCRLPPSIKARSVEVRRFKKCRCNTDDSAFTILCDLTHYTVPASLHDCLRTTLRSYALASSQD